MAAAGNEVASLGAAILQIGAKIQDVGEKVYKPSEDWNTTFPSNVETFESKLKLWEIERPKLNASTQSNEALIKRLKKAKSKLSKEEKKLKKKSMFRCCVSLGTNPFPAEIGKCLRKAIQAFDDVLELPKFEEDAAVVKYEVESQPLVDNEQTAVKPKLSSSPDGGAGDPYVPLKISEGKLQEALNKRHADDLEGPVVIILHGGAGRGKSTLARHVIQAFNGPSSENSSPFDIVRILECGPQASNSVKEFQLLQLLGSDAVASEDLERDVGSEAKIRNRVSTLLAEQKTLLLLDDVWDGQFLKSMVDLFGRQVTCLVTSQDANLCRGLNFQNLETIEIQEVGLEDGRQILASHVRSPDNQNPQHEFGKYEIPQDIMLQEIADKLIKETEVNPLVLARLASLIDAKRYSEIGEWEAVSEDLFELMKSENTDLVPEMKYPRGFLSTMRLVMGTLPLQGQKLLLLTSMCEELSVPEEVIGILYQSSSIEGDSKTFSKFRNELENQELLQVTTNRSTAFTAANYNKRTWSMHFLQKKFLEQDFRASLESLFLGLVKVDNEELQSTKGEQSKQVNEMLTKASMDEQVHSKKEELEIVDEVQSNASMVVATLCALYFDKAFAQRAAAQMGVPVGNFTKLKRSAIEPIVFLIGRPLIDGWTETSRAFASQVLLRYICNGTLADYAMSSLLLLPSSAIFALRALHEISLIDEGDRPFLKITSLDYNTATMKALVSFLAVGENRDLQGIASATISNFSVNCGFVSSPGLLEALVRLSANDSNPGVQRNCTRALANLAKTDSVGCSLIGGYPGLIEQLVRLLTLDDNPALQKEATRALGMLACGPGKISVKIITSSGLLSGLMNLLSKDANPSLQLSSAWALTCLSIWSGTSKVEIVQHPGLVTTLLKFLSQDDTPDLQNYAGIVLSLLAETKETRPILKEAEGLTEVLEGLLNDQINVSWTDRWAASILTYLDPPQGNAIHLEAYEPLVERARANCVLGLYKESLADLKRCVKLEPEDGSIFSNRCTVRGMLKNFKGAMKDADHAIALDRSPPLLTERGFLKRMTGDLEGALADFTEALEMKTVFIHSLKYEALKQRGYVKFLMNDLEGARADAEAAASCVPPRVDEGGYGSCALDQSPVEYLGYKFK